MKENLIIIILLILFPMLTKIQCQDTTFVVEGTKKFMRYDKEEDEWFFKDGLKDNYYVALSEMSPYRRVNEVRFLNGKKNGVEIKYTSYKKFKYAEVSWKRGVKDGVEVYYNGNGTIDYLLTFDGGTLNGYCESNWSYGGEFFNGYFNMNIRDSLWTYFKDYPMNSRNIHKSKVYRYEGGKKYLLSAWNHQGVQTVIDGNGFVRDSAYADVVTEYENGLRHGKEVVFRDGEKFSESYFEDGLVLRKTTYYENGKVSTCHEWTYSDIPQIDTVVEFVDTYIYEPSLEVIFDYHQQKNGLWQEFYENGTKKFSGHYKNDQRVGEWSWFYIDGQKRISANYDTGIWEHWDENGESRSLINNEYLSFLTGNWWFLNTKIDKKRIELSRRNNKMVTPRFVFHHNNQLEINSYLECGKDIDESNNQYNLIGDELTIRIVDFYDFDTGEYKFQIVSGNDEQIVLRRIK